MTKAQGNFGFSTDSKVQAKNQKDVSRSSLEPLHQLKPPKLSCVPPGLLSSFRPSLNLSIYPLEDSAYLQQGGTHI